MTDLLPTLGLILLAAELGGFVTARLGLTRVAGQIGAGLILGPSLLRVVADGSTLDALAGIGALCILAIAGLETDLSLLRGVGRPALLAATSGVILPMGSAVLLLALLGYDLRTAIFCGAILAATSVTVTVAALRELGCLRNQVGATILAAAIIDDILGLVVLGLVTARAVDGLSLAATLAPMVAVLGLTGVVGALARTRLVRVLHHLDLAGGGGAAMLGLALIVGWVFQTLGGLASITGAYGAGLLVAGSSLAAGLRERLVQAGETMLVPVFFVTVGLLTDLSTLGGVVETTIVLFVVAVLGKLGGSALGARVGGLDGRSSLGVGIGMIARGEVALVALAVGRSSGAIAPPIAAALVVVILATTIATPIGLSLWARRPARAPLIREPAGLRLALDPLEADR